MNRQDTGKLLRKTNYPINYHILENLPSGLLVLDNNGIIITFNQTLQNLSGINANDAIGKNYKDYFANNFSDNKLLLTLKTGIPYENIQPENILTIKPMEYVYVTTKAILDNTNTIIGAMALFRIAKRLKDLEQAVIQAEKLAMLGQLAASTFHEVKNQLTVAGGFLQLLDQKSNNLQQYTNIINEAFHHTYNIINDFLQLAKPGYTQRKKCNISELINHVITLIQGEATKHKLEIRKEIIQNSPDLIIDPEQIKQVLINIIKNGLEAMPNGGKLTIKSSIFQHKNTLNIDVIDKGTGMNEETKNSLFKPFYTTKKNGTGLGMFISQQIITNHGGKLKIKSQPNQGTTITIELPLPN